MIYVFVCVCYLVSASLLLHLLHLYHTTYPWIPAWTKQQLLTTSVSIYTLFEMVEYMPMNYFGYSIDPFIFLLFFLSSPRLVCCFFCKIIITLDIIGLTVGYRVQTLV